MQVTTEHQNKFGNQKVTWITDKKSSNSIWITQLCPIVEWFQFQKTFKIIGWIQIHPQNFSHDW